MFSHARAGSQEVPVRYASSRSLGHLSLSQLRVDRDVVNSGRYVVLALPWVSLRTHRRSATVVVAELLLAVCLSFTLGIGLWSQRRRESFRSTDGRQWASDISWACTSCSLIRFPRVCVRLGVRWRARPVGCHLPDVWQPALGSGPDITSACRLARRRALARHCVGPVLRRRSVRRSWAVVSGGAHSCLRGWRP